MKSRIISMICAFGLFFNAATLYGVPHKEPKKRTFMQKLAAGLKKHRRKVIVGVLAAMAAAVTGYYAYRRMRPSGTGSAGKPVATPASGQISTQGHRPQEEPQGSRVQEHSSNSDSMNAELSRFLRHELGHDDDKNPDFYTNNQSFVDRLSSQIQAGNQSVMRACSLYLARPEEKRINIYVSLVLDACAPLVEKMNKHAIELCSYVAINHKNYENMKRALGVLRNALNAGDEGAMEAYFRAYKADSLCMLYGRSQFSPYSAALEDFMHKAKGEDLDKVLEFLGGKIDSQDDQHARICAVKLLANPVRGGSEKAIDKLIGVLQNKDVVWPNDSRLRIKFLRAAIRSLPFFFFDKFPAKDKDKEAVTAFVKFVLDQGEIFSELNLERFILNTNDGFTILFFAALRAEIKEREEGFPEHLKGDPFFLESEEKIVYRIKDKIKNKVLNLVAFYDRLNFNEEFIPYGWDDFVDNLLLQVFAEEMKKDSVGEEAKQAIFGFIEKECRKEGLARLKELIADTSSGPGAGAGASA